MRLDRQRARIDAVTAAVPVVVLSGWVGVALLTDQDSWTRADLLEWYGVLVTMAVVPQLAQAVVGQLLFTRVTLDPWVRGAIMVHVWFHALVLQFWFALLAPTLWAVYLATLIVVPLLCLTRLTARALIHNGETRRSQDWRAA